MGGVRADAPQGTAGHIASGGLLELNGQAAAARVLFRERRGDRGVSRRIRPPEPWRVATAVVGATSPLP